MIDLEHWLRQGLVPPLPGVEAQRRMAPQPRREWDLHDTSAALRDAAALVLAYPIDGTPHIVLTVRAPGLRNHTGQVSLPGGRVDSDESIEAAALREASEEIGVHPESVRLVGRLTPLHVPVSGYMLHPVVGTIDERPQFRRSEWEVARILEVPVWTLRDPAVLKRHVVTREVAGQPVKIDVPYFDVHDEKVWGATAMVLSEFLAALERSRDLTDFARSATASPP